MSAGRRAAIGLAIVGLVGVSVYFFRTGADERASADGAPTPHVAERPLSTASGPAPMQPTNSASSALKSLPSLPPTISGSQEYLRRSNFRALVQHALGSKNESEISNAYLYVQRCGLMQVKPAAGPKPEMRSPQIEKEAEAFRSACGELYGKVDRQLAAALVQAKNRIAGAHNGGEPQFSEVRGALLRGDSELALEAITKFSAITFKDYLSSIGAWDAEFEKLPPDAAANYLQMMFRSRICERFGCDAGYSMVFNCEFFGECSQASLDDQMRDLYAKIRGSLHTAKGIDVDLQRIERQLSASVARGVEQFLSQNN